MNDLKNLTLAWVSSTSSVFAAVEAKTWVTVTSAVVLPIIFFALGKTVDVLVQVYLSGKSGKGEEGKRGGGMSGSEPGAVATGFRGDGGGGTKNENSADDE